MSLGRVPLLSAGRGHFHFLYVLKGGGRGYPVNVSAGS
jgi:hypothetical protein